MKIENQAQLIGTSSWLTNPRSKLILSYGTLVIVCIFLWLTYNMVQKYRTTLNISQQQAELKTQEIAETIDAKLAKLVLAADELAENLYTSTLSKETIEFKLRKSALNHTDFYALGTAFNLYKISPQLRLFAPFIYIDGTTSKLDGLDHYYDYISHIPQTYINQSNKNWFSQAIKGKNGWLPPSFDIAHNQHTLKYVTPIRSHTKPDEIKGVVFLDIGLKWIRQQVENHHTGENAYTIIVNEQNQILYHGLQGSQKTVNALDESVSPAYIAKFKAGIPGKNKLTGRPAWLHHHPIGETGWQVLTIINIEPSNNGQLSVDVNKEQIIQKSDVITWIASTVTLCLFIYLWVAVIRHHFSEKQLWRHAFVTSFIFTLGIVSVWLCESYAPSPVRDNSLVFSNRATVDHFQDDYTVKSIEEYKTPLLYIPTGLFIQSIEFLNATNVTLTGYLWQRYPRKYEEKIEYGVIFPEAVQTTMNENDEYEEGDEIIKSWYFETTLRESFDYSLYPFDRQLLWARLWHRNFTDNVVLVPDFKSYDSLHPNTLPGIERDFVLSGWRLSRTFFDMRINTYNTNFGNVKFSNRDQMPELYFNVELSRNILNPFIAHLFPLVVVLLMLYALVLTISRKETSLRFFGFDVSTLIASSSALFFLLLIMHVQLRDELSTNSIVYMEYFYLVSYITILMITVNSILFSWDPPIKFVEFKDNLIPKLLYWPVLLMWFFVLTVFIFQQS